MFAKKKDAAAAPPFTLRLLRVLHVVLVCHALAIIGIACFVWDAPAFITAERAFALAVGLPIFLASALCWLALMTRGLFGLAIFFCTFLTLAFAALPIMVNVFFPMHLPVFFLAGVYGLSAVMLARNCFMQPVEKKK
jgi:hypothetical protein